MPEISQSPPAESEINATPLAELALLFLRLGTTAFGGPAAHIAMMEDEVVRRRRWLNREAFLDLLGATNIIPGPNSTEMAIHIGYQRRGWAGLVVAGVSFIVPAFFMVLLIAWAYVNYGRLPQFQGVLYGVKPVVLAIILQALWRLGQTAIKTLFLAGLAILTIIANFAGVNELIVLLAGGILAALRPCMSADWRQHLRALGILLLVACAFLILIFFVVNDRNSVPVSFSLPALFMYFLKVGSVLYGSGYVLLAFLQADLVGNWHWLTTGQLLDATAVGQITPGPVFTTATFIGYLLGGLTGALIATCGIFLPAFFFVAISSFLIPRLRRNIVAGYFLDGLNVGSLALMVVVTFYLTPAALVDWLTILLSLISLFLLVWWRLNSIWLILLGALTGYLGHIF
jgi:chromate transporter